MGIRHYFALILLVGSAWTLSLPLQTLAAPNLPPASEPGAAPRAQNSNWKRYKLKGDGDSISVSLPSKPAQMDSSFVLDSGHTIPAKLYLAATNGEVFAAVFIKGLPDLDEIDETAKSNFFHKSWVGVIRLTQQTLEEGRTPSTLNSTGLGKWSLQGHDGRQEEFHFGEFAGQAKMFFVHDHAFLLIGIRREAAVQERVASFFGSLEMTAKGRPDSD